MARLSVVTASTRENRVGLPVTEWFLGVARQHGGFDVAHVDLKTLALPLLEEPNHPRVQQYQQPTTKAWSRTVAASDAFVFVTPEYNAGMSPALLNALDHLYVEWNYKAAAFVSYGGISGGMRSVQMSKLMLTTLKMVPLWEAVNIPFVTQHLDPQSRAFMGGEKFEKQAHVMLDELVRWTAALATLRAPSGA
jgi:NAD(P)H-dependent FMN reductase